MKKKVLLELPSRSSFASVQNNLHEFIMLHWVPRLSWRTNLEVMQSAGMFLNPVLSFLIGRLARQKSRVAVLL